MTTIATPDGRMLFGGDYNPEQWPEEVWAQDMALFAEAGITSVTVNVFSWAALQPEPGRYDFERLDKIVATVRAAGLTLVLATSTAALPAWMSLAHPDVNRVDVAGRRMRHGQRHNPCMSSPTYRSASAALAGALAQRYVGEPGLVAWHVSNEYGGFCWCDLCAAGFRDWLARRYADLAELNDAWNTAFWGHTYHSWDEIFPPNELGDLIGTTKAVLPGAALDYRRFYGEMVLASYREEKAAIRAHDADTPVTTNFMGTFADYDYFAWTQDLDLSSWDSYPTLTTAPSAIAMRHDLMRAVGGGGPWMLMEQTPSRQNWQAYNSLKRPGQMRQQSWQAVAHGADTVQFFQLRQNRAGCEKFHGAVVGIDGTNRTRTFREVADLGAELAAASATILGTLPERARVGIVYDWPSRWAIDASAGPSTEVSYEAEIERWYGELYRRNIRVDMVPASGPFADYDVVLAPLLYLLDDARTAALRAFVAGGGRLLLTPLSALADEHDRLFVGETPVPLRDLAGIWVEETDALAPGASVPLSGGGAGTILCDVVHPDPDTRILAEYAGEYYAGTPALTRRDASGGGAVFYCATFPAGEALSRTLDAVLDGTGIVAVPSPEGVEVTRRTAEDGRALTFVMNTTGAPRRVSLPGPGRDLLTGTELADTADLPGFGVLIHTA